MKYKRYSCNKHFYFTYDFDKNDKYNKSFEKCTTLIHVLILVYVHVPSKLLIKFNNAIYLELQETKSQYQALHVFLIFQNQILKSHTCTTSTLHYSKICWVLYMAWKLWQDWYNTNLIILAQEKFCSTSIILFKIIFHNTHTHTCWLPNVCTYIRIVRYVIHVFLYISLPSFI